MLTVDFFFFNIIPILELFSENLTRKEKSLNNAHKILESLKKMEIEINKKISSIDKKKSELMTLEGQNQEKISTRNKHLIEMATIAGKFFSPENSVDYKHLRFFYLHIQNHPYTPAL